MTTRLPYIALLAPAIFPATLENMPLQFAELRAALTLLSSQPEVMLNICQH